MLWLALVTGWLLGAGSVPGLGATESDRQAATEALARGDRFTAERQFDRAIAEYTRAINLNPDFAEAFNNRGFARHCKREGSDAVPDLSKAIALREAFPHAHNTRGCSYLAQGRIAEAIADFDRAIQLQPDYPRAYRNRGHAHLLQGSFRLAIADLERAGSNPTRILLLLAITLLLVLGAIGAAFYYLIWARGEPGTFLSK